MGWSYWILVWDGWGCGLDMINPRLHTTYDKQTCMMRNSFTCAGDDSVELISHRIGTEMNEKYGEFWKVIRS